MSDINVAQILMSLAICQEIQPKKTANVRVRTCVKKNTYAKNADGDLLCKHCSYTTKKQSTMSMHMSNTHAADEGREVNPHKCSDCGEGFSAKTRLQHHIKNHHDITYLKCPHADCGYNKAKNTATLYPHYVKSHMPFDTMYSGEGTCNACGVFKKTGIMYHLAVCSDNSPFYKSK
jgi:hypothetical protein